MRTGYMRWKLYHNMDSALPLQELNLTFIEN